MNNDKELHTDQEKHTDQENESGSEINKTKNTKNNCATSEAFLFKPKKKKKKILRMLMKGEIIQMILQKKLTVKT